MTPGAFERGAWEIAQESSIKEKNRLATEVMDRLGVPRNERKQVREMLLKRAEEIASLRSHRAEAKAASKPIPFLSRNREGKYAVVIHLARREIRRRGIEGVGLIRYPDRVYNYDPETHTWLVGREGYQEYTRSEGYYRKAKWLFGRDDAGYWAVRVPSTCRTAKEALDWLKPAAVRQAEEEGRWVARQGDVYLVELKASRVNTNGLPGSHCYDSETRTFYHEGHKPVVVPEHVKGVRVFAQSQINPYGGRLYAD